MVCKYKIYNCIFLFAEWRWRYYWLCQHLWPTCFWSSCFKESHYQGLLYSSLIIFMTKIFNYKFHGILLIKKITENL